MNLPRAMTFLLVVSLLLQPVLPVMASNRTETTLPNSTTASLEEPVMSDNERVV